MNAGIWILTRLTFGFLVGSAILIAYMMPSVNARKPSNDPDVDVDSEVYFWASKTAFLIEHCPMPSFISFAVNAIALHSL